MLASRYASGSFMGVLEAFQGFSGAFKSKRVSAMFQEVLD